MAKTKSSVKIEDKKWTKESLIAANEKGVITNSFMDKKLKELGLSKEEILKIKKSGFQDHIKFRDLVPPA